MRGVLADHATSVPPLPELGSNRHLTSSLYSQVLNGTLTVDGTTIVENGKLPVP